MRRRPFHSLSIRARLVLLALACSLPLAAFAGAMASRLIERQYAATQDGTFERVRLLSSAVDQALFDIESNLRILATSPTLKAGNLAAFYDHAVAAARLSAGTAIVLVDRSGNFVINTVGAFDAPKKRRVNRATEDRVFATGKPQVSDMFVAVVQQQPIISVEVPVTFGDTVQYVLAMGLRPNYFMDLLKRQQLPADWRVGLVDRNGVVITGSWNPEQAIGRPAAGFLAGLNRLRVGRWLKRVTRDDIPVYVSFVTSQRSGWTTAAAVPQIAIDTPFWQGVGSVAAVGATVVALSVLAALLAAGNITRPLAQIAQAAQAIGRGVQPTPELGGPREFAAVQRALVEAGVERDHAVERLQTERALLEAVVRSMPVGVLVVEAQTGRFLFANEILTRQWGRPVADLHEWRDVVGIHQLRADGSRYAPEELPLARSLRDGEVVFNEETTYHRPPRPDLTIIVNSAPVRNAEGRIVAAIAAIFDVTDRKQAMDRQELLLGEINHRVKNTMATIQSIAFLSLRSTGSLEEFGAMFQGRLVSLAQAHDLLTRHHWQGAAMNEVLRATLAPYYDAERIAIHGEEVHVSAKVALALTVAVHELGTNSSKYGALSVPGGRIEANWHVIDEAAERTVVLTWSEHGGPPVRPPTRRGFGTRFIETALAREIDGKVVLDFEPSGVRCRIEFPLRRRQAVGVVA